ncbi:alpha/beta hydrolase [Actibacterium sp. MT2.3-13A]|uniref:alpha/beta fold hydrolase n=1 Tax=Actibacterium sp. MT2.3-13A TaxID=2828332 RepID=UPI001BA615CD|nr:alpha/beta hydrolase [Actibacterium sp. MT2.3-13A]
MLDAPLFHDLADGPAKGSAYWLTAGDGRRLRIGVWPEGERGTVLLFPGRTEYVEKYGRAARDLRARGFATVVVDWRGQGLADRLLPDRAVGFVERFTDYQHDVAAVVTALPALALPRPLFLLSHSMGGCIGLRAIMTGLKVEAACFSGPMWDIELPALMRPAAWALTYASRKVGLGARYAPGSSGQAAYPETAPFDGNELTTDREMYAWMRRQTEAEPALSLGGPSLHWVHEALCEIRALRPLPSPALPALTFVGSDETIVAPAAIEERMARWPGGVLNRVAGARHEVMMETPERRALFFDTVAAFFDAAGSKVPSRATA